jgi:glycosyltransferase involved in cell wall biosynthesis
VTLGIGVSTHNRPLLLKQCHDHLSAYTADAPYYLVVVDDGSDERPAQATVRHAESLGVAAAKNACLRELMSHDDVDHIFLFDDDTWPIHHWWWDPYVESGCHHLGWLWAPGWDSTAREIQVDNLDPRLVAYTTGTGAMLYYSRKAIETVGGMRTNFGRWGFEHAEHSWRIHNAGLTPWPFLALRDQDGIYASDEHHRGLSVLSAQERALWYVRNRDLYAYWKTSSDFVPYADPSCG